MVSKLRLTLAILSIGFMIQASIESYTYLSNSYQLPFAASIFILGPSITFVGLIIRWIGRHEWDELFRQRFRHSHRTFFLSVLAMALAILPIVWYGYRTVEPIPWWAQWEFGAAIIASLLLTFATYVLIAFDLTATVGRTILLVSLIWATAISYWIGQTLAQELGTIALLVQIRSMDIRPIGASIAGLEPYLALTNILLVIAYLDAYRRALPRSPKPPAIPVAPSAP